MRKYDSTGTQPLQYNGTKLIYEEPEVFKMHKKKLFTLKENYGKFSYIDKKWQENLPFVPFLTEKRTKITFHFVLFLTHVVLKHKQLPS